jgi:S-adenosylmethionine-diacylglycerol 3-amino-3-carboxypropyl transferase
MIRARSAPPEPPKSGSRNGSDGGFHSRFFGALLGRHLIFNTSWEDPALDRVALELGPSDRLLAITGAGCNVLDYLLAGAGEIHAVDLNPCQNALLELKRAGILRLSQPEFFELFGLGRSRRALETYHRALRPELSPFARRFWDRRIRFFDARSWQRSFYYRGTAGFVARLCVAIVHNFQNLREPVEGLLAARTVEEQRSIYEGRLRDRLWTRWVRWFLSHPSTLSLVGVPRGQHEEMLSRFPNGAADYIRDCFEAVVCSLPFQDNYFWRVYFKGHYTPECCPEYLKPANFEKLRANIHRVRIHTTSVTEHLRRTDLPFSRFVLLDHMDWLRSRPEILGEEWTAILSRSAPDARAIFRSAGSSATFLEPVLVRHEGRPARLTELLRPRPELAADLHARDRVHTYGSFHIVHLPG